MRDCNYTMCYIYACHITLILLFLKPGEHVPPIRNYLGDLMNKSRRLHYKHLFLEDQKTIAIRPLEVETKVGDITLNCTALKKVNFDVMLRSECDVEGRVTVVTPFKITRDK